MYLEPAQMENVIRELKKMYAQFNIEYANPVFNFEGPQDTGFADRLHLERIFSDQKDSFSRETIRLTEINQFLSCSSPQFPTKKT